jgi:hypothetical protein
VTIREASLSAKYSVQYASNPVEVPESSAPFRRFDFASEIKTATLVADASYRFSYGYTNLKSALASSLSKGNGFPAASPRVASRLAEAVQFRRIVHKNPVLRGRIGHPSREQIEQNRIIGLVLGSGMRPVCPP